MEWIQKLINAIKNQSDLARISGRNGFKYISFAAGPAYTNQNIAAILIRESSVLTVLTATDAAGNNTDYLVASGLSGIILNTPDLLTSPGGMRFTAITFSSGSAIGYL